MNKEFLEQLLYRDEKEEILDKIKNIDNEMTLFIFAYNYNWDNGFEIPSAVLKNVHCTLNVALLLFYSADGLSYLQEKKNNETLPEWSEFIEVLYENILEKKYMMGTVSFEIPLTKVQLFKLKKNLSKEEEVFVNNISGEEGYISI